MPRNFVFQSVNALLVIRVLLRRSRGSRNMTLHHVIRPLSGRLAHVAYNLSARLAGKRPDQRRLPLAQAIQCGDYVIQRLEAVHAVGAAAQFAWSLRSTQKKHTHDRDLATVEVEDLLQAMLVLGDA